MLHRCLTEPTMGSTMNTMTCLISDLSELLACLQKATLVLTSHLHRLFSKASLQHRAILSRWQTSSDLTHSLHPPNSPHIRLPSPSIRYKTSLALEVRHLRRITKCRKIQSRRLPHLQCLLFNALHLQWFLKLKPASLHWWRKICSS